MIEVAKRAALNAGRIIIAHRNLPHLIKKKGTTDNITTEVDRLADEEVLKILKRSFPKHNFWTEDSGREDNGSEYTWIIDNLDGTGPFSVGMPLFGVSVGLVKDNKPILGVINLPALEVGGSLYWAQEGKGAFLNKRRIRVTQERSLKKVYVGCDFAWIGMRGNEIDKYVYPIVDKVRNIPILLCTVASLCYVASGVYGGYIHWAYAWDFAAGSVIIQEAGGIVTDPEGKDIDWSQEAMTIVAGSPAIHDKIIKLINK